MGSGKKGRLSGEQYESELFRLQAELVKVQEWVRHGGHRVVIVFEGRDAAGKGAAADIAVTAGGTGYWVLMADGGIYPFGSAGYASSPKKAGLGGTARRIARCSCASWRTMR